MFRLSTLRRRNVKNAALFLRLGLPSSLFCYENGVFRKLTSKILRTLSFPFFMWTENILKRSFSWPNFLTHTHLKWPGLLLFKFPRRSVDRKHLMRFQSETSVFKFVRQVWTRAWCVWIQVYYIPHKSLPLHIPFLTQMVNLRYSFDGTCVKLYANPAQAPHSV